MGRVPMPKSANRTSSQEIDAAGSHRQISRGVREGLDAPAAYGVEEAVIEFDHRRFPSAFNSVAPSFFSMLSITAK
jgi:hypothetical protein